MNSSTTTRRLVRAARSDSWRTLSEAALADLVARGLFDADLWTVTPAGQAVLDELAAEAVTLGPVCAACGDDAAWCLNDEALHAVVGAAEAELAAQLLENESRAAGRREAAEAELPVVLAAMYADAPRARAAVERDWSTLALGGTFVSDGGAL